MSERVVEQEVARDLGARFHGNGTRFRVWSSEASEVFVQLFRSERERGPRHRLEARGEGSFELDLAEVGPGTLYQFVLDGQEWPDPYARFLPYGVHGPAEVIDSDFTYRHAAPRRALSEQVLYEIHVGTFTEEGTYRAAEEKLAELAALGVTTLELMPIAAFPGRWGWGYDGVATFAPFAGYGRPEDLRHFIDVAHGHGLSVILDVVYNHLGPSGNYLGQYSPRYFNPEIETPWGRAPRFDDAPMRGHVIENALYWLGEFRFDGLRLDATHAIFDASSLHVIAEIVERTRRSVGSRLFIAEDDRNDPEALARMGVDAVWADDFHHVLHVLLTGERDGYYAAYEPSVVDLARTIERGWFYEGQPFLGRRARGKPATTLASESFVYCLENHDQVGNRPFGTRLAGRVDDDLLDVATTLLFFLPATPLLFMGQEWGASSPFLYFTDHEPELGRAVSAGRRREFAHFAGFGELEIPDPQAESTFLASKLDWSERSLPAHARRLDSFRRLLALRRSDAALREPCARADLSAHAQGELLIVRRRHKDETRTLVAHFGRTEVSLDECARFAGLPALTSDDVIFSTRDHVGSTFSGPTALVFRV